ncbi:hypothetical protein V8J88_13110 [Massilia sp. W12]|uniref:lipopolysaccharide biosynthesis protein n=1 Tax=Massilia sp. W12 TaxID=3126507 RepID=UPI0030CBD17A
MAEHPYQAAQVARQAKWFALAKLAVAVIALATQFVLVRALAVEDYAAYTIFISCLSVLVFCTMYGVDRIAYRFVPPLRQQGRWRELCWLFVSLSGVRIATILLFLGLLWLGQRWLPAQLWQVLQSAPWAALLYALALGGSDSFPVYCNALGLQSRQAFLQMGATCLRMALLLWLGFAGQTGFIAVAWMMAGTEVLLALALKLSLVLELRKIARAHPASGRLQFGFAWGRLWRDSISTQFAYLVNLPFRGVFLRLIVGSVASPVVVAAFGFFQTLADRAYQLTPMFLMRGMLEPTLAADYAEKRDPQRIRLVMALLLRVNAAILCAAVMLLAGCGKELIDLATHGRYGSQVWLALLIVLQLAAISLGEALWIGLNPMGRLALHNRIWNWAALLCYVLLAAAAWAKNSLWLVAISALPYFLVFAWLRWKSREPLLQAGLGLRELHALVPPLLGGVIMAKAVLLMPWPASWQPWPGIPAALAAMLAFAFLLRRSGMMKMQELQSIHQFSPKLARILRLVFGVR